MKNLKAGLFVAALVSLICMFTPNDALAQDDGPVPRPCHTLDQGYSSVPRPCRTLSQDDDLIPPHYISLTQDDGPVPRLYDMLARVTPFTEAEIQRREAWLEGAPQKYALIQS